MISCGRGPGVALAAEGFNGTVYLFKNNTDSAGNSYGSHENYLIPRRGEFSRLAEILIPFLVTRQLIAGAGKILKTPHGATYAFSQRADLRIWEVRRPRLTTPCPVAGSSTPVTSRTPTPSSTDGCT